MVHRVLGELRHDALRRVDEEARMGGAQHARVVVGVARGHHLEVQPLQRVHRVPFLVGLAQLVVGHEALGVDLQLVAKEGGAPQLAHQRVGKLVEGVRQDDHLVLRAQTVQEVLGALQGRHAGDHRLDVGQLQPPLAQQADAKAHQLAVVRLIPRGTAEFRDAGALGEGDPDFRDENAFQVEADDLHAGLQRERSKVVGAAIVAQASAGFDSL